MDVEKPYWVDRWVVMEPGAWRLREGAPLEVIKAFEEFMKLLQEIDISKR